MLEHLQQRVAQTLAAARTVTLTTSGAAGLQAGHMPCLSQGLRLLVLVPRASDHLYNLETDPRVVVINNHWNLKGTARVLPRADWPPALREFGESAWSEAVEVQATRLTLIGPDTGLPLETIDVE